MNRTSYIPWSGISVIYRFLQKINRKNYQACEAEILKESRYYRYCPKSVISQFTMTHQISRKCIQKNKNCTICLLKFANKAKFFKHVLNYVHIICFNQYYPNNKQVFRGHTCDSTFNDFKFLVKDSPREIIFLLPNKSSPDDIGMFCTQRVLRCLNQCTS